MEKDLGLLISRDLKWTDDIKAACSRALSVLFLLKRSSSVLTMPAKLNLFKSVIIPVLIYGGTCWYANVDSLKALESVQKRSLKWVSSDQNSNYKEVLSVEEILPLSLYMQLQDLLTPSKRMTLIRFMTMLNPYICLRNCLREIRSSSEVRFDYRKPRIHQYEQNIFYRAGAPVKRLPTTIDITNPTGLKQRLLDVLWSIFNDKYNELVSATRRM